MICLSKLIRFWDDQYEEGRDVLLFWEKMVQMQDDEDGCAGEECDVTEEVNEGPSAWGFSWQTEGAYFAHNIAVNIKNMLINNLHKTEGESSLRYLTIYEVKVSSDLQETNICCLIQISLEI